ncbi:unnamed protein product [Musa textilis]
MNDRGTSNSHPSPRKGTKTNRPSIWEDPWLSPEQPEFVPVVDHSSLASDDEEEEQNNKDEDSDNDKSMPSFPTQSEIEIRDKVDSHLDQSETKMKMTQSEMEIHDKVDSYLDQSEIKMEMTQSETEIRDKVDSHLDQSEAKMEVTQSEIEICDKVDSHLDVSKTEMEVTERETSDSNTKPPEKMMTNLPTISETNEEAELVPTVDASDRE